MCDSLHPLSSFSLMVAATVQEKELTPSDVASLLYKYCCVVIMMHQAVDKRGASLTEVKEYNFSEGEGKTEGLSFNRSCVCAQCCLKEVRFLKTGIFRSLT